jgi:hypothetical protein
MQRQQKQHTEVAFNVRAGGRGLGEFDDMALIFRPEIGFDGEDAIIWGDEGKKHFRVRIKRNVLIDKFGVKSYFDRAEAAEVVKNNRHIFEKMAQDAYDAGKPELIIGVNTAVPVLCNGVNLS